MPLTVNGWTLLFHDMMLGQIRTLAEALNRARLVGSADNQSVCMQSMRADPTGFRSNANVRVLASVAKLTLQIIPQDPGHTDYRIGNTMGTDYRHWSRAKFGQRFRLFFRYDSAARIIVFAWVNDEKTLRARGSKSDPYAVFKAMLDRGNPPDSWKTLLAASKDLPSELQDAFQDASP